MKALLPRHDVAPTYGNTFSNQSNDTNTLWLRLSVVESEGNCVHSNKILVNFNTLIKIFYKTEVCL